MATKFLKLHPRDNLIVALKDLNAGDSIDIEGATITLKTDIPAKHKFSSNKLEVGDPAYMYGVLVGKATATVEKGGVVAINNLTHASDSYTQKEVKPSWTPPDVSKWKNRTFNGYHRADGSVGTANYWLVVPLVFCENRNLEILKETLSESLGYISKKDQKIEIENLINEYKRGASKEEIFAMPLNNTRSIATKNRIFPNVDGIKFLKHEGGCGGTREDAQVLCQLLAGYITNPNVAGATVIGLGCQNAQVKMLKDAIAKIAPDFSKPLYIMEQQDSKNERAFLEEASKHTFLGLMEANKNERKPAPLSKLVMGLECGGSDGFSGISANPALGYASDLLVALGGSAILSEFPELNGVEQDIVNRCARREDAERFMSLMQSYNQKAKEVGSGFENNPSPGNIKDGLITDAMKSAGAAKKGGTSLVANVLDYTEKVTHPGLNLLCTPGNDVESTTGLAASGANIIVFTTGLGTPTGNPVAPVVKVSSNTSLFEKMRDIIDINAGTIISGEETLQAKGEEILEYVIAVASGEIEPASVRLGQDDFIPWKRGISL